jgi:hypothetical protein
MACKTAAALSRVLLRSIVEAFPVRELTACASKQSSLQKRAALFNQGEFNLEKTVSHREQTYVLTDYLG